MRRFARVLGAVAATLLATGGPAGAIPFGATLGLSAFGLRGGGEPVFVTGSGSGTSAPVLVTLPGGVFAGSGSAGITGNPFVTALQLTITGNGPGSFAGPALSGGLPLRGHLLLFGNMATVITLIDVPLSIPVTYGYLGFGVGGTVTLTAAGGASFAVQHGPWSEGPALVTGLRYTYTYHLAGGKGASRYSNFTYFNGTAMYTGTDSRTPGGLGQITLVSPTKVQHLVGNAPGGFGAFVVLGTLTMNFVPEPGTLVLLGAGVVGLALAGRTQRRCQR